MAEIKKDDIFEPGTIEAPLEMAKNMDKLLASIQDIIKVGKQSEAVLETATSTKKLTDETKNLSTAQTELDKVQKQFATSTQKLSDEYLANKRALNSVNDEVKKRLELGDKEAKDINAKNASLKQLEAALLANRKAYADLSNEQDRNSKAGKELLNVIKSQDVSVKSLRDSMGQAQAHVGGYREAIEQALGSLGKLNPEMAEVADKGVSKFGLLTKLISGPFIAAFAAAFAVFKVLQNSIEDFTTTTAEGAKGAKYFMAEWHAAQEVIRDGYLEIGRALVNVGQLNRTTGEGFLSTAARFLGFYDLSAKLVDKTKEQITLIKEQTKVREDEIVLAVKGSELELTKSIELFNARDKLLHTDIERIEAVDKAEKAILEKEALEKKLVLDKIEAQRAFLKSLGAEFTDKEKALDLLKSEQVLRHVTKDQIKELAELEGDLNKVEQGFFDSGRRRQAMRITATEDYIKHAVDSQKMLLAASDKTEESILHKNIDTNNRIIGNQEYTLDQQLAALQDNQVQQSKLIDVAAERDKRTAADNAFTRVEVDTKALRAILDNTKLSAIERAQALFDERVKAVHADEAYQAEVIAIDKKAAADRQTVVIDGTKQTAKLIVSSHEYFLQLNRQGLRDEQAQEVQALNERFVNGEITLRQYNIQKNKITNGFNKADLNKQVEAYKDELNELKKYLNQKQVWTQEDADLLLKVEKSLSDAEIALTEENLKKKKAALEKQRELLQQFQQEAFNAVVTIGNNAAADQLQQSQVRINALTEQKDKEIEIAGDNAEAKKHIEEEYNKKVAEESKKALQIRQEQARFDRDIAAFQVIIKTAEAIADQLPFFPFSAGNIAVIGAIGALQEAAILSRPIPAYELGTKNALGGLAIVGEKGAELIKEPGKDWTISPDSTSMVKLAAGSEVIPHEETMRRLALSSLRGEAFVDGANFALHGKIVALQETIKDIGAQTVKAIEESRVDFEQHGSILYKAIKKSDGSKRLIRCKSLSS